MSTHRAGASPPDRAPSASLDAWMRDARVRRVVPDATGHVIHSYFNASPESPDARFVLYFGARTPDAHHGDVCIIDRASGAQHVVEPDVEAEDAHRVAYQQWSAGGRTVVLHALRDGRWQVIAVDVDTLERRVLAEDRQLGFGDPTQTRVPLHGLHWNPGAHRNLELLDVETGRIETLLTPEQVRAAYPEQVEALFGDRPISVFFPIMAPGGERVFFKLASVDDGTFRSKTASQRHGLVVYDMREQRFTCFMDRWGHPSWHPDGRTILNVPNVLIDSDTGATRPIPGLPRFPGSHPTVSPAGGVFATDLHNGAEEPRDVRWSVAVADLAGHHHDVVHTFHPTPVTSWRPPHPHPAFSADGRRLYFNASDEQLTQLHVAAR